MSAKDLIKLWKLRDNSRLTSKQMSVRLPTHVAARISAICEVFPNKTKTQVIGDLLSSALDELEKGMSYDESDNPVDILPDGEQIYAVYGPGIRGRYLDTANKHLKELESEIGNDDPELFYVVTEYDKR